jgi:hypothetical protein
LTKILGLIRRGRCHSNQTADQDCQELLTDPFVTLQAQLHIRLTFEIARILNGDRPTVLVAA